MDTFVILVRLVNPPGRVYIAYVYNDCTLPSVNCQLQTEAINGKLFVKALWGYVLETAILICAVIAAVSALTAVVLAARSGTRKTAEYDRLAKKLLESQSRDLGETERRVLDAQDRFAQKQSRFTQELGSQLTHYSMQTEQKLENIRLTTERHLEAMQSGNAKKLDEMRAVVEEKLQQTLETRIGESFRIVSERLEQVYKGLGEMQTLASGVGDLKKVLTGVKTRGILGEAQLGAILRELLTTDQYGENVAVNPGRNVTVEYAVKLPGGSDGPVWLPLDAKFPYDRYSVLCDAYEDGGTAEIELASRELVAAMKASAKEIRDKYIAPPHTTEFAIMFLPFEGLYAEAVRRGMVDVLAREYHVTIAGPTTMGALLNSLQMGFRTLAIQKRSNEVWRILGQVKSEFGKFNEVLEKTQKKLEMASTDLEKLVGARSRMIYRSLSGVEAISEEQPAQSLQSLAIADGQDEL